MSKVEELRAFVRAQLDSTAEEISDYYERLMAQTQEELRRSERENQQKQRTLNQVLNPRVVLYRLGPDLPQDVPEPPQVKEEHEWSVKQEKEDLPV